MVVFRVFGKVGIKKDIPTAMTILSAKYDGVKKIL